MRRREFIVGLGAAITGSIQTNAQESCRLYRWWAISMMAQPKASYSGKCYFAKGSPSSTTTKVAT